MLRVAWWRGGPDCPIMNKFYPCDVSKKLLSTHSFYKGKSSIYDKINDLDCMAAKLFI